MSRRGDITIECDSPDCHAEIVLSVHDARESGDSQAYRDGIGILLGAKNWWTSFRGLDRCPQCEDEVVLDGLRCNKCLAKLGVMEACGDCDGGTERDPQARSLETAA
jgi:predicted RNA-binding Zn-ribbon protein involved in translation (DUF1610 family)